MSVTSINFKARTYYVGREVVLLKKEQTNEGHCRNRPQVADKMEHKKITMQQGTGTFVVDLPERYDTGNKGGRRKETKK